MGLNPQQLRQKYEDAKENAARVNAAIAAGTMRDPRLDVQIPGGAFSASTRKYMAELKSKQIGVSSPSTEADLLRRAVEYEKNIRETREAVAEQRVRASRVGASSFQTAEGVPTTIPQQQQGKESYLYKVTLQDNVGASSEIGGHYGQKIPKNASYFVLGGPAIGGLYALGERNDRISKPYGPPEKPEIQGPTQLSDPLGVTRTSNILMEEAEKKAIESKKILDSDAPIFGFRTEGTKARALIEGAEAAIGKNVLGLTGFINIGAGMAAKQKGEPYQKIDVDLGIGDYGKFEIPSVERVKVQPTAASIVLEKAAEGKSTIPEIAVNLPVAFPLALKEFEQKYGTPGLVGEGLSLGADIYFAKGLSPLKLVPKFIIPLESGLTKTVRSLVTYGGKEVLSKVGSSVARTSESAVLKSGVLEDVNIPQIVKTFTERPGGGAELEFLGPTGEKVFTSEKVLERLKNIGKFSQDDISTIKAAKTIVQESKGVPDKPFRTDYSAQPFENIPAGPPTIALLKFFKEKGITLEGSAIDIPTFLPEFAGKAGDFDVHFKNFATAKKINAEAAEVLNKVISGTKQRYVAEAGKLHLYTVKGYKPKTVYPRIELESFEVIHGTSKKYQRDILSGGIDISASKRGNAFFTTTSINLGKHYAKRAAGGINAGEALLKIKIEPTLTLRWKNVPKEIRGQLEYYESIKQSKKFQPILIKYARSKGFKAVEKPYNIASQNVKTEIIIFDEGAIRAVEPIKLGTRQVPILGKKLGKTGEFLSIDDPESVGQISKSGKVFGVKTPQKTIKIQGIKQKTLKFQLHRRGASVSSLKLEGGIAKIGPPSNKPGTGPTRLKDYPRLYAGAKTASYLIQRKPNPVTKGLNLKRATNISNAANEIKRIGEQEINFEKFFEERRLTETYVQKPTPLEQLTKSIINIGESPKTISGVYSETLLKNNLQPQKEIPPSSIDREVSINASPSRITKTDIDKGSQLYNLGSSNLSRLSSSISKISKSSPTYPTSKSPINSQLNKSMSSLSKLSSRSGFGSPVYPKPVSPVYGYPVSGSPIYTRYPIYPRPGGGNGGGSGGPPSGSSIGITRINIPPINPKLGGILGKQTKRKPGKVLGRQKKRLFIADPADPLRAGVISPRGVSQLISKNPSIFKKIDVKLGKARQYKYAIRPFSI